VSMTNSTDRVEIITSVQRRRRWTAPEKVRMVEETFEPGMTVSLVARRHGVEAQDPKAAAHASAPAHASAAPPTSMSAVGRQSA
jgi:transposase-like protein